MTSKTMAASTAKVVLSGGFSVLMLACTRNAGTAAAHAEEPVSHVAAPLPVGEPGAVLVVAELYSSEGCSSCPPAEDVLRDLDRNQPVSGVHVIALEFHVDYWNQLGWVDPFSRSQFSERQRAFNRSQGRPHVYTPQVVIDGDEEGVGSDRDKILRALAAAGQRRHLPLRVTRDHADLRVETDSEAAVSLVAVEVERGLQTTVTRGENQGRVLLHGPIVRAVRPLAVAQRGHIDLRIPAPQREPRSPSVRIVVLATDDASGRIVGAGEFR